MENHYRSRSRAVRAAAQRRLAALRAERVAKVCPGARPVPVAVHEEEASADPVGSLAGIEVSPTVVDLTQAVPARAEEAPEPAPPKSAAASVSGENGAVPEGGGSPPDDNAAPGDLHRLPAAGPGLVWLLERAGYRTLADLAMADALAVARALGPAGRLLDVPAWILAARTLSAGEDPR